VASLGVALRGGTHQSGDSKLTTPEPLRRLTKSGYSFRARIAGPRMLVGAG
jgi:hypothetical protein